MGWVIGMKAGRGGPSALDWLQTGESSSAMRKGLCAPPPDQIGLGLWPVAATSWPWDAGMNASATKLKAAGCFVPTWAPVFRKEVLPIGR
jgi:hypothetical protein